MKAVFLDRDGTIIMEPPNERLTRAEDIKLFPDTLKALKLLQANGFALIVITNQAGVGEGLITFDTFEQLEKTIEAKLAADDVKLNRVYVCPHVAADNCDCRKPKPKLIADAARDLEINLTSSFMVGDRLSDIQAGINAGAKTVLVKTGIVDVVAPEATYTAINLLDAVQYIVNHS